LRIRKMQPPTRDLVDQQELEGWEPGRTRLNATAPLRETNSERLITSDY
jgi:hypothetical protein